MKLDIFLLVLFTGLSSVTCAFEKKHCEISNLDQSTCPINSHCSERVGQDECTCSSGYIFNAVYETDQDYCLVHQSSILPAAISISGATNGPETPHHHIVGGILIPLFLVAAFVGGAFFIVRYRLIPRVRDRMRRRRRHRPHMGNEFDPPLI